MKWHVVIKLTAVLLLAVAVVITSPASKSNKEKSATSKPMVKIGILQIAEHPALDEARKGFIDGLAEAGFVDGDNITITYLNAQGDQSNLKVMSQSLVADENDLILAIATPSAQALANETSEIPILATAVTDLEAAKLVDSNELPGTNVTGTSDMTPIKEQLALIEQLVPDAETVGFLYNSSEVNSKLQIDIAEQTAKELGYQTTTMSVTNTNDVAQSMQILAQQSDVVYIPADNTLASAMATIGEISIETQVPVIGAEANHVKSGALATVGVDYNKLGKQTAEMAVAVLNGEPTETMPVQTQDEFETVINGAVADKLGITIPKKLEANSH